MNQHLISLTKQKIKELTLCHFRLLDNTESNFVVLSDIFTKEESISKCKRLTFETQPKTKCLEFLQRHNLITDNYRITALGFVVILSHKLGISVFSIFILSKLYNAQITIKNDMFFPYPILDQWFESFPSVNHIRNNISNMKQKQILDNNLRYRLARINLDKLNDLKKYDKYLKIISQYVDDVSIKIDNLISADPQVIKHREKNSKLFAGIKFV